MRKKDIKIGDKLALTGELEGIIGEVKIIKKQHIHIRVGPYWVKAHHSLLKPIKEVEKGGI